MWASPNPAHFYEAGHQKINMPDGKVTKMVEAQIYKSWENGKKEKYSHKLHYVFYIKVWLICISKDCLDSKY